MTFKGELNPGSAIKQRVSTNFTVRLVRGVVLIAVIGMFVLYLGGSIVLRSILYENLINMEQQNIKVKVGYVEAWFKEHYNLVNQIATTWQVTGVEPGETGFGPDPIGARFLAENDSLGGIFVGFENGWHVNSSGWIPPDDFDATQRPWFQQPAAARGDVTTSLPYERLMDGELVSSMGVWLPEIMGMEAVVVLDILLAEVFEMISAFYTHGGGHILLFGPNGETILPPACLECNLAYTLSCIEELRNSGFFDTMQNSGYSQMRFESRCFGESFIFTEHMPSTDWTFATIIPVAQTESQINQYIFTILVTFFAFFILFILLILLYTSRISKQTQKLENELKNQEINDRVHQILNNSPIGISWYDSSFHMIDCNQAVLNMFGAKDKDKDVFVNAFRTQMFDFFPVHQPNGEQSITKFKKDFEKMLTIGYHESEWTCIDTAGNTLPIAITGAKIETPVATIIVVYARDLRAEIAAKEKEMESRQYIDALFQASPMFIDVWDDNFNLIDCNDKVCILLGISSKEEFLINHYEKYTPKLQPCGTPSKELSVSKFKIALKYGYVKYEWNHLDVNGEEVPLETTYIRITTIQGKSIFVGYNYDLREIKRAQKARERIELAEESNRIKSDFLAHMSHEIRTPISAVMGISEIAMQDTDISPRTEESFANIYTSANHLLGIVNDILDMSKIETGKMFLIEEEYDVPAMIVESTLIHFTFSSSKEVQFNLHVDENIPCRLLGDKLRISQIITNILSNAFKYTDNGLIELSISSELIPETNEVATLVISITDTGFGMSEEQVKSLGSEYIRFNERKSSINSGIGLGMSIVYKIINLMNATIEVKSEIGVGTKVLCRIPQQLAGSEVIGSNIKESLEQFKEGSKINAGKVSFKPESMPYGSVLVVDDLKINLYVTKGLLNFYNVKIETCTNGYDAINKIKQGKVYDIIFMDHMMPELDGIETLHKIRKLGYQHPVIVLTANAMVGQAESYLQSGFDGFISKPIHTKHLNAIMIKHIKNKYASNTSSKDIISTDSVSSESDFEDFTNNPTLLYMLEIEFAASFENTLSILNDAINTEDFTAAHILMHSIKGASALINEHNLSKIAQSIESSLAKSKFPETEHLHSLEKELINVLDRINSSKTVKVPKQTITDDNRALDLLTKLEPLLVEQNALCLIMLDELSEILEFESLHNQIKSFDFVSAHETLTRLKLTFGL